MIDVHLERLPIGARQQVLQGQARWMIGHLPAESVPAAAAAQARWITGPAQPSQRRVYAEGLLVQGWQLDQAGPPTVLLHSAGGSGDSERTRLAWPVTAGPLITIDLSGHGDSAGDVLPCDAAARQALAALQSLHVSNFHLRGRGYGAAVATHWALQAARIGWGLPQSLQLEEVPICADATRARWAQAYAQPIEPAWDGSHLIALWHTLRDRELFHPWFERQRRNIRSTEPHLDAEWLTQSVFAALQCADWVRAHQHWLSWDPLGPHGLAAAANAGVPVRVLAQTGDGWARGLQDWMVGA